MKSLQKILPPVYFFLSLVIMFLLHYLLPLFNLIPLPYSNVGIPLILTGLFTTSLGATTFRKADTPVKPFEHATALITHGLFRFTRNPMYLGMLIILLGSAFFMGSLSPFLVIPVFFIIIQEGFVKHEEEFLEHIFGDVYREYKARVRRWF